MAFSLVGRSYTQQRPVSTTGEKRRTENHPHEAMPESRLYCLNRPLPRSLADALCRPEAALRHDKQRFYSMTSSARARRDCGTVRPTAFAVLRLMISSILVGAMTGRSATLAPLRICPVYLPTCCRIQRKLGA